MTIRSLWIDMTLKKSMALYRCQTAAAAFGALCSTPVCSQEDPERHVATTDQWAVVLGAGAISAPKYPGAGTTKVRALPVISVNRGRFFFGGMPGSGAAAGLGAYLFQDRNWKFGLGLGGGFSKIRKESDDPRLTGLGDVDDTVRASLFASYSDHWYSISSAVSTDIAGKHEGTTLAIGLEGRYRATPHLTFVAGPEIQWGSHNYTQTLFGIDANQSARSGLPEYATQSGVTSLHFGIGAQYVVNSNWGLGLRASVGTLTGDAKNSPITEKKRQDIVGAFATYHF